MGVDNISKQTQQDKAASGPLYEQNGISQDGSDSLQHPANQNSDYQGGKAQTKRQNGAQYVNRSLQENEGGSKQEHLEGTNMYSNTNGNFVIDNPKFRDQHNNNKIYSNNGTAQNDQIMNDTDALEPQTGQEQDDLVQQDEPIHFQFKQEKSQIVGSDLSLKLELKSNKSNQINDNQLDNFDSQDENDKPTGVGSLFKTDNENTQDDSSNQGDQKQPNNGNVITLPYTTNTFSGNNYYRGYNSKENAVTENSTTQPGLMGLTNLGNTCYMNSSLQALMHTPNLAYYFTSDSYQKDLNLDNPLGQKGELAKAFADLMKLSWKGGVQVVTPRGFKAKLEEFAPQFEGYNQQDAQELLMFLMDGIHEDVNRIIKKPYIEEKDHSDLQDKLIAQEDWQNYKRRNDSELVDKFIGLEKSTLDCPNCNNHVVKFQPFTTLSLPVPSKRSQLITVIFMDGSRLPQQYVVTLQNQGVVSELYQQLAQQLEITDSDFDKRIYLKQISPNQWQWTSSYVGNTELDNSSSLDQINQNSSLLAYIYPDTKLAPGQDKQQVVVFMQDKSQSRINQKGFGAGVNTRSNARLGASTFNENFNFDNTNSTSNKNSDTGYLPLVYFLDQDVKIYDKDKVSVEKNQLNLNQESPLKPLINQSLQSLYQDFEVKVPIKVPQKQNQQQKEPQVDLSATELSKDNTEVNNDNDQIGYLQKDTLDDLKGDQGSEDGVSNNANLSVKDDSYQKDLDHLDDQDFQDNNEGTFDMPMDPMQRTSTLTGQDLEQVTQANAQPSWEKGVNQWDVSQMKKLGSQDNLGSSQQQDVNMDSDKQSFLDQILQLEKDLKGSLDFIYSLIQFVVSYVYKKDAPKKDTQQTEPPNSFPTDNSTVQNSDQKIGLEQDSQIQAEFQNFISEEKSNNAGLGDSQASVLNFTGKKFQELLNCKEECVQQFLTSVTGYFQKLFVDKLLISAAQLSQFIGGCIQDFKKQYSKFLESIPNKQDLTIFAVVQSNHKVVEICSNFQKSVTKLWESFMAPSSKPDENQTVEKTSYNLRSKTKNNSQENLHKPTQNSNQTDDAGQDWQSNQDTGQINITGWSDYVPPAGTPEMTWGNPQEFKDPFSAWAKQKAWVIPESKQDVLQVEDVPPVEDQIDWVMKKVVPQLYLANQQGNYIDSLQSLTQFWKYISTPTHANSNYGSIHYFILRQDEVSKRSDKYSVLKCSEQDASQVKQEGSQVKQEATNFSEYENLKQAQDNLFAQSQDLIDNNGFQIDDVQQKGQVQQVQGDIVMQGDNQQSVDAFKYKVTEQKQEANNNSTQAQTEADVVVELRRFNYKKWRHNQGEKQIREIQQQLQQKSQQRELVLADCIEKYLVKEELSTNDTWYCPKCKQHVQAIKKMDLWDLPDTLVIQIKRFSNSRTSRKKVEELVEFPIENLDLTPYLIHEQESKPIYDLFAVVYHYGYLSSGHYNACCLVPSIQQRIDRARQEDHASSLQNNGVKLGTNEIEVSNDMVQNGFTYDDDDQDFATEPIKNEDRSSLLQVEGQGGGHTEMQNIKVNQVDNGKQKPLKQEVEGNVLNSKKLLQWGKDVDLNWYKFDDSRVYEVNKQSEIMNQDAYILFYKKRENKQSSYS